MGVREGGWWVGGGIGTVRGRWGARSGRGRGRGGKEGEGGGGGEGVGEGREGGVV